MKRPLKTRRHALQALLGAGALVLLASGPADAQVQRRNPTLVHARGLVQRRRFREAIPVLRKFLQTFPSNLEGWTLLGRSYRGVGNFQAALRASNEALRFQPNHPPAIENVGMVYLEANRLPQAEQQLARLSRVCRFGCIPYDRLKRAVDQAKARQSGRGRDALIRRN